MLLEDLSYQIRGAIFAVYNEVGPGLLESFYEAALCIELESRGLNVQRQVPVTPSYKGKAMEIGYRLDLLVNGEAIIEVKSVDELHDVHKKQLLTYLKLTGKRVGILINFNVARIENKINLIRIVN